MYRRGRDRMKKTAEGRKYTGRESDPAYIK